MYKVLGFTVLLVVLVSLAGCGDSADSLVKQQISDMNKLADAIESDAKESELKALQERMEETGKRIDKLELSDTEKEELAKKHGEDLAKAFRRLVEASMKKARGGMEGIMKGMMKGMMKGVKERVKEGMKDAPKGMPKMPDGMPKAPQGMPKIPA